MATDGDDLALRELAWRNAQVESRPIADRSFREFLSGRHLGPNVTRSTTLEMRPDGFCQYMGVSKNRGTPKSSICS